MRSGKSSGNTTQCSDSYATNSVGVKSHQYNKKQLLEEIKLWMTCFQVLNEKTKKQDEDKAQHDTDRDCEQLVVSSIFDDIEQNEPLIKISTPKYLGYKRTKDHVTYVLHFKMTMIPSEHFSKQKR